MSEETLTSPRPVKIIQRSEDEISRVQEPDFVEAAPLNPQRAQTAFYRPFVPDDMEESNLPGPLRGSVSYHSVHELTQAKHAQVSHVEQPKGTNAEKMFKRPGFDNVPSY